MKFRVQVFFLFFQSPRLAIDQSNSVAKNPAAGGKVPSCQGLRFLSEMRGLDTLPSSVAFPLRHPKTCADRACRSLAFLYPRAGHRGGQELFAKPAERSRILPHGTFSGILRRLQLRACLWTSGFDFTGSLLEMQSLGPQARPTEPESAF